MSYAAIMQGSEAERAANKAGDVAAEILWHVEQVCGPLSTDDFMVVGDNDRAVLLHKIRAVLNAQWDTRRMAETGTGSVRSTGSPVGDSRCAQTSPGDHP